MQVNEVYLQLYGKDPSKIEAHKLQLAGMWLANAVTRGILIGAGVHPVTRVGAQVLNTLSMGCFSDILMGRGITSPIVRYRNETHSVSDFSFPSISFLSLISKRPHKTDDTLDFNMWSRFFHVPFSSYNVGNVRCLRVHPLPVMPEKALEMPNWWLMGLSVLVVCIYSPKAPRLQFIRNMFPWITHPKLPISLGALYLGNVMGQVLSYTDLNAKFVLLKNE